MNSDCVCVCVTVRVLSKKEMNVTCFLMNYRPRQRELGFTMDNFFPTFLLRSYRVDARPNKVTSRRNGSLPTVTVVL